MKVKCISFLIIGIIALSVIGLVKASEDRKEYLRIHVRANSNSEIDQSVKYLIKDKIVEYLTPYISTCDTAIKAEKMLNDNLSSIERVANAVLEEKGFDYESKVRLREEKFPTRVYGELTLEAGFYQALIVELGSGNGDNWWCVVYPPLCFTDSRLPIKYRSKILEIIDEFFN